MKINKWSLGSLISLSVLTIAAPIAVNFSVPLNPGQPVEQVVEDMKLPAKTYDKETFSYHEVDPFYGNLQINQTELSETEQLITIAFENDSLIPITLSIQPYTPKEQGKGKGIKTDSTAEKQYIDTVIVDGVHTLEFTTSFTSAWRILSPTGERFDFVNDFYMYSPTYKYQLKGSDGNNSPVNEDIEELEKEYKYFRGYPSINGELDLILDFRNPEIHDNSHIQDNHWTKPQEYFNLWEWGEEITLDLSDPGNYVTIATIDIAEVQEMEEYDPKELDNYESTEYVDVYFNSTFTVSKENPSDTQVINGKDVTFAIEEDGYAYLLIEDVVNLPEDRMIAKKFEYANEGKIIADGVEYTADEAGSVDTNGLWFTTRETSPAPEGFIFHERGDMYWKFNWMNPVQTTLSILGGLWIAQLAWITVEQIKKRD